MNHFGRRPLGPRLSLSLPWLALLAVVALYEPFALLVAAPWLLAVGWSIIRTGLHAAAPPHRDAFPSTAEAARRRLSVR